MTTVRLDRVVKVFPGGHVAVDGVDLTIEDGEMFVLVGPSGCGKTTVLRMIAGFEQPTAGVVSIDGRDMAEVPTRDRGVAMLFQECALYPHLTAWENLAFPLRIAGVGKREVRRRVTEVAAALGLGDQLELRPSRLSGGQRQRVAMGRVLVRQPSVILMDEPMSNLDAKLRTELRADIARFQRRLRATALYVTHDQVEAMALGDRVGVMRNGRIVQSGPPIELYHRPRDVFVAGFIGSPPMNIMAAAVSRRSDGWWLHVGGDDVPLGDGGRWGFLSAWCGRDVAVGIRPEGWSLTADEDLAGVRVEVTHVEHLGAEHLVTGLLGARAVRPGTGGGAVVDDLPMASVTALLAEGVDTDLWRPIRLSIDPEQLHWFDPVSGLSLASAEPVVSV